MDYNLRMNLQPVYLISVFISLCTLIIFYKINANKINKNYLMMFLTTLISNFGYAMAVNREGLQTVLDQVSEEQAPALELQLRNLAESSAGVYWMSTVDYACRFILTAALARVIWYAFEGGREPEDRRLIGAAFILDFLCELMLALHSAGASYHLCAAFYYVLVACAVCLAYTLARRRDDPQKLKADHLRGRAPRKRRY